jgi:hypothetical protein
MVMVRDGNMPQESTEVLNSNVELLNILYKGLWSKDHVAIAECYQQDATFTDISFSLCGKNKIHAMWHMICETDLRLSYRVENADPRNGSVRWVVNYTFNDNGTERKVRNELRSSFEFKDGLIIKHTEVCDARQWAMQALGPVKGIGAWLAPTLRRKKANEKLQSFINRHPEYQQL